MKAFKVIKNPEAFQLLADETRRKIVYLLRAKEQTVSQIAEELNLTPQAIYHHIRKLKEAEMVEIAREERVDHFIETYYQASAEVFHVTHGDESSGSFLETSTKETLGALAKLGIDVSFNPEVLSKIVEVVKRMKEPLEDTELNDKAAEMEDIDFFAKQCLCEYAYLITVSEEDFEDYLNDYRELRRLLRSPLKKPLEAQSVA